MKDLEAYLESLGWKKLVLLLGIISLVLLTLLFISIGQQARDARESIPPQLFPSVPTSIPVSSVPMQIEAKTQLKTGDFHVLVPADWVAQKFFFIGGTTYLIRPKTAQKVSAPAFLVDIYSSPSAIFKRENLLKEFNYKVTSITFHGVPARKLTGQFPDVQSVSSHSQRTLQETYIVTEYRNKGYVLKYQYYTNDTGNFEDVFSQIIDSFVFIQEQ